jgi:hypothetical protein
MHASVFPACVLQLLLLSGQGRAQQQLDDVSEFNRRSSTLGSTPEQLPWIDFSRPARDGLTCWELGLGERIQASGNDGQVGSVSARQSVDIDFSLPNQLTLDAAQSVELTCLGGRGLRAGLDGSRGVFEAGPGTPNYELLLVASDLRGLGEEVTFDLTPLLEAGGLTPQRTPPRGASTVFDARRPSHWSLRLRNLNRLVSISMDLQISFSVWTSSLPASCEVCNVGVCSDCKSCVNLATDERCEVCYAQTDGVSCLAADYSACENTCWSGRAGNVPIVLVNPMTGSSIYMDWDKPDAPSICRRQSDGLQPVWPPDLKDVGRLDCTFDNMKLLWDDRSHSYTDRGVTDVATTPPGAPPGSDALTTCKVWQTLVTRLECELGYSPLTQMRTVSYDWRMGARNFAQPGGSFDKTKRAFEDSLAVHGRPALAVSFSMGSPFLHAFLQQQTQEWKDEHVAGWTSLAGPFAGSVQLFLVGVSGGETLSYMEILSAFPTVDLSRIRDMAASWGVVPFMSPRPTGNAVADSMTLAQIQEQVYTFEDGNLREILALAAAVQPRGVAAGGNEREDADSAQRALEVFDWEYAAGDTTSAPGVPFWCVYSLGTDTVTSFTYRTADMSDTPTPINGDGDATVHAQSLQVRAKTGRFLYGNFLNVKQSFAQTGSGQTHDHVPISVSFFLGVRFMGRPTQPQRRSPPAERWGGAWRHGEERRGVGAAG